MNIEITNLDNLTEVEKETFNRLVAKANKKSKVFKPEYRQEYFCIDLYADILNTAFYKDNADKTRFELGNIFETKEQAEFALEKQKVYMELKRYALEHNEFKLDWNDKDQCKWCIGFECGTLCFYDYYILQYPNQIYFTSEEIAQNAIDEIGEDRIKKYLFEVGE